MSDVATLTLELARSVEQLVGGTPYAPRAAAIVERLGGPMRVAIAGRVKAGKSTLLNALVGERLAPTDAGECTRLISWYRHGIGYRVAATLPSGAQRELSFTRDGGALDVRLGDLSERDVASLDIQWPASTLKDVTLIDTPGLASVNDENSRRTRDFLEHDDTNPTDADAVIYLMRHLHRSDVEFLDAFMDRSVTAASPVNAVAVLSRADEIGAGRLDAIDSARRIADRYRNDPAVQRLAATVMPIAGLLAETGLTLLESEAAALHALASTPDDVLERMLLDADAFADIHASDLTVDARRQLIDRLGMFGVRVAVREVRGGRTTAAQLGPQLVEISGLAELRRVIAQHFGPRARVLQARSALAAVRALARDLRTVHATIADQIDRHAERLEASAVEFGQIRAAHLVASGVVRVSDGERRDLQALLLGTGATGALGLDEGAGADAVRAEALRVVTRWRTRAADPLADPRLVEVAETAARTGESLYTARHALRCRRDIPWNTRVTPRSDRAGPAGRRFVMTTGDATIRKALSSQDDLIARREHCSVDGRLLESVGAAVGRQLRLGRTATEYGLYTVSERHDEDAADVVRLGLTGRRRLGTDEAFDGVVVLPAAHPTMSDSDAETGGELVERLDDDGEHTGLIVIAPHGGDIERHTDEQAERVAARLGAYGVSSWRCKGWKEPRDDGGGGAFDCWHITSTDIDPSSFPGLGAVIDRGFVHAVAFHGFDGPGILIGGTAPMTLKEELRSAIEAATSSPAGFVRIATAEDRFGGDDPANIVNRLTVRAGGGVQIEQTLTARRDHGPAVADAVAGVYARRLRRPRPSWRERIHDLFEWVRNRFRRTGGGA